MDVSAANPPNVYSLRHNGAVGGLLGRAVQLPWKGMKRGERQEQVGEGGEGSGREGGGEGGGRGGGRRGESGEGREEGEIPSDLHTR